MGIDVQLRDERGVILAEVGDKEFLLSRAIPDGVFRGTNLLRYIVPWGDAIFNQAQSVDLLKDITYVISTSENKILADHCKKIVPLIKQLEKEVHSYLWFVGD